MGFTKDGHQSKDFIQMESKTYCRPKAELSTFPKNNITFLNQGLEWKIFWDKYNAENLLV